MTAFLTAPMILGIVRHLLTSLGGFLVAQGWVDEGSITELVGAAMTLAGFVLSMVNKR